MERQCAERMELVRDMAAHGVFDSPFDKWWKKHAEQYMADALHMSEYHMASVVWAAACEACASLCEHLSLDDLSGAELAGEIRDIGTAKSYDL